MRTAEYSRHIAPHLTDDLRRPKYRGNSNIWAGHCYVVSEVIYHLNYKEWNPCFVRHEGEPHWYLTHVTTGRILDLTASQFKTPVSYDKGVRKGFLTRQPSKRAKILMERIAHVR